MRLRFRALWSLWTQIRQEEERWMSNSSSSIRRPERSERGHLSPTADFWILQTWLMWAGESERRWWIWSRVQNEAVNNLNEPHEFVRPIEALLHKRFMEQNAAGDQTEAASLEMCVCDISFVVCIMAERESQSERTDSRSRPLTSGSLMDVWKRLSCGDYLHLNLSWFTSVCSNTHNAANRECS